MMLQEIRVRNFKKIKSIDATFGKGVTNIIGKNRAGKTSLIDSVAALLGGKSASPDMPIRIGESSATIEGTLCNGDGKSLKIVKRYTPKTETLDIIDEQGIEYKKCQTIIDKFIGPLSFDPLEFARSSAKEKRALLANYAGVDIHEFEAKRKAIFDERTAVNRQVKAAKAQLDGLPEPPADTPDDEVSVAAVLKEIRDAELTNNAADAHAKYAASMETEHASLVQKLAEIQTVPAAIQKQCDDMVAELERRIAAIKEDYVGRVVAAYEKISKLTAELEQHADKVKQANDKASGAPRIEISTLQLKAEHAEATNAHVRQRHARAAKAAEVATLEKQANDLTATIDSADTKLANAIAESKLPVPGLVITPDDVLLNGVPLSQASGAESLRVSVAIAIALNPNLPLMLVRDGSLLDDEGRTMLEEMALQSNAQIILELVDNGDGVGIRIVDGEVAGTEAPVAV